MSRLFAMALVLALPLLAGCGDDYREPVDARAEAWQRALDRGRWRATVQVRAPRWPVSGRVAIEVASTVPLARSIRTAGLTGSEAR
ncbi:MAG: hypothetical protein B7733_03405 [Myxococcales bacterium FL481]|nr:MAG: hypothetical protein B7733_03405 [Myxococcales bacterium FL481]